MKKILILTLFAFLLMNLAEAEIYTSSHVIVDYNQGFVTNYGNIYLTDTSIDGAVVRKPVPVTIYYAVQNIPYNISYYYPQYSNAYVDYCNFTLFHDINQYDDLGNVINISVQSWVLNFTSNATDGAINLNLVARDTINYWMKCHYTNNATTYIDSVLFGQVYNYFPAFECKKCETHSFEELSKENEALRNSLDSETGIEKTIFQAITQFFKISLIVKYLVKIGMIFMALGLIFIPLSAFLKYLRTLR